MTFAKGEPDKFGRDLESNIRILKEKMKMDYLDEVEQNTVITLIQNCSFRKRKNNLNKEPKELLPLIEFLCSADLAEAVGDDCLNRAKQYYIGKIKRNENRIPNEYECCRHVYLYYHDTYDGYWPRMNAIKV